MKKLIALFFCLSGTFTYGQNLNVYQKERFVSGKDTLAYRILYPENYDANKQYPVVFFLHGSGERGSDNEKQLTHGGKLFLSADFRKNHPSIVIFPQCPADSYWSNVEIEAVSGKRFFNFVKGGKPTKAMGLLLGLVSKIKNSSFTDPKSVYVGGLSMGGMGTFELLRRQPRLFAAAFAICGGDHISNVKKYQNVPLWIFHGGLDDIVTPQFSYEIFRELRRLGKEPKFTVYPKANHNSWDSAFAEPGLIDWLFGFRN